MTVNPVGTFNSLVQPNKLCHYYLSERNLSNTKKILLLYQFEQDTWQVLKYHAWFKSYGNASILPRNSKSLMTLFTTFQFLFQALYCSWKTGTLRLTIYAGSPPWLGSNYWCYYSSNVHVKVWKCCSLWNNHCTWRCSSRKAIWSNNYRQGQNRHSQGQNRYSKEQNKDSQG